MNDDVTVAGSESDKKTDQLEMIQFLDGRVSASARKWEKQFKCLKEDRAYTEGWPAGQRPANGEGKKVLANLVHATLAGIEPYVFATSPEIAVRPAQQVDPTPMLTMLRKFASTMEAVLNRAMLDASLKSQIKRMIRSAMTTGVGWIKVDYQRDVVVDRVMPGRQDDTDRSLMRLQSLMDESEKSKSDAGPEPAVRQQQAEDLLTSLFMQTEAIRQEGIVIDQVEPEDIRMDPAVACLADYLRAEWIAFRSWYTPDQIMADYGLAREDVLEHTFYPVDGTSDNQVVPASAPGSKQVKVPWENALIAVWECWDRGTNTVYIWGEGGKRFLKDPAPPMTPAERFYPFFMLSFNWVSGKEWPISDVEIIKNLQDEYQNTRTQQAKHRDIAKPTYVGDADTVEEGDVVTFTRKEIGEVVLVAAGGRPIDQVFSPARVPPYNPTMYDTTPIRSDIEWISGLGDAQRGGVMRAKTATEANHIAQGLASRVEDKQDQVEEVLTGLARYIAQILLQELPEELVKRFAGPTAVWPQTRNKWWLYNMLEIEIRAGSTGKPDKDREIEQWVELTPLVLDIIGKALDMMIQYNLPLESNPYVHFMRETFRRFDDRIDITEFFAGLSGDVGQQAMMFQLAMKNMVNQPPPGAAQPGAGAGSGQAPQQPMNTGAVQ